MNFEGQNISLQDALFVDNITGDIERFRVRSDSVARVLVFPPVNNYHRFLIHKVGIGIIKDRFLIYIIINDDLPIGSVNCLNDSPYAGGRDRISRVHDLLGGRRFVQTDGE